MAQITNNFVARWSFCVGNRDSSFNDEDSFELKVVISVPKNRDLVSSVIKSSLNVSTAASISCFCRLIENSISSASSLLNNMTSRHSKSRAGEVLKALELIPSIYHRMCFRADELRAELFFLEWLCILWCEHCWDFERPKVPRTPSRLHNRCITLMKVVSDAFACHYL